jgi:hypothetical protein
MTEINRRELILVQLGRVLADVNGIVKVYRNRIDIPEHPRPACVILDADESAEPLIEDGRGRPGLVSPIICTMTPEIYILGAAAVVGENIGTVLNTLRSQVIKGVLNDQTLIDFTHNGDIQFLGFATGFASGRSMEGEAGLSFQFRYLIQPSKL